MRRVVLICGPPGAGKTTLARSLGLPVFDRDDPQWRSEQHFTAAIKTIGANPQAQAVVIRSGAKASSRKRAASIIKATEIRVIDTPVNVCIERINTRGRNTATREIAAAKTWWREYNQTSYETGSEPRQGRAWRRLRDQVVQEEPLCWLGLPGCTRTSTTADHVLTVKARPDLALDRDNLRGACASCNYRRNDKPIEALNTPKKSQALDFFS